MPMAVTGGLIKIVFICSMSHLNDLRKQKPYDPKRLIGNNAPETSYVMLGHGSELPHTKIVPEGCILVVNVHSGSLNYIDNEILLNELFNPDTNISLDPITNYKEIVKAIKKANEKNGTNSLAIYREGDKYPDFQYTLLNYWDSKDDLDVVRNENSFLLETSGIIQYPFKHVGYYREVQKYDEEDEYIIAKLFIGSILPFPNEDIEILKDEYKKSNIKETIDYLKGLGNLRIKQSDLFKMVTDGRLIPGVFYNLVCRETYADIRIKNGTRNILDISKYLSNVAHPVKGMRREFLEGIGEAELHRGPLIERLNLNSNQIEDILMRLGDVNSKEEELLIRRLYNTELQYYYNNALKYFIKEKEKQDIAMTKVVPKELPQIKYEISNNEEQRQIKQQQTHNRKLIEGIIQEAKYAAAAGEEPIKEELVGNNIVGYNNRRAAATANAAAKVALWRKKGGSYTRKAYKRMSKKRNR
jgi:hypothetical protein